MDPISITQPPPDLPWLEICIFFGSVIFLVTFFNNVVLSEDKQRPVPFKVSNPEQCNSDWQGDLLEEPSIKIPGTSAIQCYNPANGRLLGLANPHTADGIDRAIAKAKEAQPQWAKTTFSQRRKVMRTLLQYVLDNQEIISKVACLDSGKTMIDASLGEILVTVEKLKWTIQHGEKALRPESRPGNFLMMYKQNEVRWEPLGVVAACVSWNYPFHNFISPVISSLFSGNAIIIKASENTAWSSQFFATIARGALASCGHSPNLVQPVVCWPNTANHLTSHPSISHVTFIGSRTVAHQVALSAAKSLTPLVLELGGKDPAIILDDVRNLEKVTSVLLRGTFQASGQNCIGFERLIALPSIYPRLLAVLEARIAALRSGSGLESSTAVDIGAMISPDRFSHLENLIQEAVSHGATLLAGGSRLKHTEYPRGHYFQPTLIANVTPDMRIAQEELFAPICTVMPATSITDAIAIANSTPHALGSSVFGSNRHELDRVAREVNAGMVAINDFAVYYAVSLPFGGVKGSGYGRFGGEEGLRGLCNLKAVCRDRFPGWVETSIPPALDYPIKQMQAGWEFTRGVIELGYEWTLRGKTTGLWRLVRNG